MTYTATDLFSGGGGSSLGAESVAEVRVEVAANHWSTAIDVHQAHFPETRHDVCDISQADPRRYPRTNLLMASPECFTAGHLVTTVQGQRPIEDVQVGDLVLTAKGRWREVIRVQERTATTVLVRGQGHTGIETTAEHPFLARGSRQIWDTSVRQYRRRYSEPTWLAARQLEAAEAVWATPVDIHPLPELEPPAAFGLDQTAAWWLIGRWVGDGSVAKDRNEVTICCGHHEADALTERLGDTGRRWARREVRTATLFTITDVKVHAWLTEHFGIGAAGKYLHSSTLTMQRAHREALLDGYLSADGGFTQRRVRASTVSRALAVSVRLLAEGLGHRVAMAHDRRTTWSIEGRSGMAKLQWILHWEPTLNQRRQPEAFVEGGMAWSRVRKVSFAREAAFVYNLEVADDESYVIDGIAVHNCTNHSQARGVSRKKQNASLFDTPDPAAERSRSTMWDVGRFAEQLHYDAIVVENVVEATRWTGWHHWLGWLTDLGYSHKVLSHNSMHHQVPQSRDRIYVVLWRKGLKPDLELELTGWCARCETVRPCRQAWKNGRTVGRYRAQYVWSCTTCHREATPGVQPAATIIDRSLPCSTIGSRTRPLAPATRARVLAALRRFGWVPVVTAGAGHVYETTPGNRARPLTDPLPVQHTSATTALATPPEFLFQTAHGGRATPTSQPHPTVCASDDRQALITLRGTDPGQLPSCARSLTDPVSTVSAGGIHHALLMRNNTARGDQGQMSTPVTEPARTMTTAGHQSLLVPYYRTGVARTVGDPAPTVTTRDRVALLDPDQVIDECGFRMLEPHEIAAAMAFPAGYFPDELTKRDRVKLAGNAVTPPVMAWIVGRLTQALEMAA